MDPHDAIAAKAAELVRELLAKGKTVATAESCTGGWIAKALTDVPGSSACFGYGVVSYSNDAKQQLLGVSDGILREDGAVSEAAVLAMARGVLEVSGAQLSVAVSGIAGPDGGTPDKPVGTVWFAFAERQGEAVTTRAEMERFTGDRASVRAFSVVRALTGLGECLARL